MEDWRKWVCESTVGYGFVVLPCAGDPRDEGVREVRTRGVHYEYEYRRVLQVIE
jgi:hypothetical protein